MLLKFALIIVSLLMLVSCERFFVAKQQVFMCKKNALDGEKLLEKSSVDRYFHFNDLKLNVSIGPVGVGLSEYNCDKTEFIFTCKDTKRDNFDDQITLDRYTLFAQQVINTTEKTSIIDYECFEVDRKVE